MKIIPLWPRASLPRFYQGGLAPVQVGIVFIILALSRGLTTLLRFSLANLSQSFSFDKTYVLLDYFQVSRVFFVFYF